MIQRTTGLLLLLALSLADCSATVPTRSPARDQAAIQEASRQFSAAFMRGDAAAMADLYTPDGVIFPNNSERISGREAIQRYWTLPPNRRVTHHQAIPTEIRVENDHAYDYGVYELRGERDGEPYGPVLGNYVIVWRRQADGVWRMHLDIWNNRPQPNP